MYSFFLIYKMLKELFKTSQFLSEFFSLLQKATGGLDLLRSLDGLVVGVVYHLDKFRFTL